MAELETIGHQQTRRPTPEGASSHTAELRAARDARLEALGDLGVVEDRSLVPKWGPQWIELSTAHALQQSGAWMGPAGGGLHEGKPTTAGGRGKVCAGIS